MIAYARVRLMSRSISYSRYFRMATPMLTGNATMASREMISAACAAGPPKDVTSSDTTTPTTTAAAPPVSHLSCSRRWSVAPR